MKKTLGGILLAVGIAGILWGVFESYLIFTAQKQAPQIFKETAVLKQTAAGSPEEMTQKLVQEQLGKMLPEGSVTKLLNLIAWSIFTGLVFLAASKMAGIGIKLLQSPEEKERRI